MERIVIKEPLGFQFINKTVSMDVDDAVMLLRGRKQRKYTNAIRLEQSTEVEVSKDLLICPYCYQQFPAYGRYLNPHFRKKQAFLTHPVKDEELREWGSRQVGFIEPKISSLRFNFVYRPEKGAVFFCPKCREWSLQSKGVRQSILTREKGQITLAREILNMGELMNSWFLDGKTFTLTFPLYERIVFCFRNGHTYVTLGDAEGKQPIAVRDISDHPYSKQCRVVEEGIVKNKMVFRTLKRLFIAQRGGALPFQGEALTLERFIMMTRFPEYGTKFFDEIPYDREGEGVEHSFKKAARRLHTAKKAIRCFEASALPKIKSVRGIYFNRPALLFYQKEGERLFQILQDPNYFCRLLKSEMAFELLAHLHQTPLLFQFIEDYCRLRGGAAFLRKIHANEWKCTKQYAAHYGLLRREDQLREQKRWLEKGRGLVMAKGPVFSRPFRIPDEPLFDCVVEGFQFTLLRSKRDYREAGWMLENCLEDWEPWQNPVVCVFRKGKAVAAIELCGNLVVQALGLANGEISECEGLSQAFEKWREKFNLRELRLSKHE